jgi:hypothetical protein
VAHRKSVLASGRLLEALMARIVHTASAPSGHPTQDQSGSSRKRRP